MTKREVIISALAMVILFFTSSSLALERVKMQTEPVQKPQIAPKQVQPVQSPKAAMFEDMASQRLQQIKANEESKSKSDLQRREQEIASRMRKTPLRQPCEVPTIKSVYPAEVYPYSPILIEGCGFQSQDGSKAVMLAPNYKDKPFYVYQPSSEGGSHPIFPELLIDSWTDTVIKARVPALVGFPNPIPFTLKVLKGFQGKDKWQKASAPSPTALLRPQRGEFRNVEIPVGATVIYNKPNVCSSVRDHFPGLGVIIPKIYHFSNESACTGKDHINLNYITLHNNWVFYDHSFYYNCMQFFSGTWSVSNCDKLSDYGKSAKLDQKLGDIKGKTSLPNVTVSWDHRQYGGIVYTLVIVVEGPIGTSP